MNQYPVEIIHASLEGKLNLRQEQVLSDWLNESADNRLYYSEFEKVYKATCHMRSTDCLNQLVALGRVNRKLRLRQMIRWSQRIAACLLLVLSVYFVSVSDNKLNHITAAERQVYFLDDSSKVILAANSELFAPTEFDSDYRKVKLIGKAYFEVKKESERPFIVETPNNSIRVVGTQFLVDASKDDEERVSVDEGCVLFYDPSDNDASVVTLTQFETGVWKALSDRIFEHKTEDKNINSWLSRKFVFEDVLVADIIEQLQRAFDIKIEVANAASQMRYTGAFSGKNTPESILKVICMSLNMRLTKEDGVYRIKP